MSMIERMDWAESLFYRERGGLSAHLNQRWLEVTRRLVAVQARRWII